jgi:hypothetical protein
MIELGAGKKVHGLQLAEVGVAQVMKQAHSH